MEISNFSIKIQWKKKKKKILILFKILTTNNFLETIPLKGEKFKIEALVVY